MLMKLVFIVLFFGAQVNVAPINATNVAAVCDGECTKLKKEVQPASDWTITDTGKLALFIVVALITVFVINAKCFKKTGTANPRVVPSPVPPEANVNTNPENPHPNPSLY